MTVAGHEQHINIHGLKIFISVQQSFAFCHQTIDIVGLSLLNRNNVKYWTKLQWFWTDYRWGGKASADMFTLLHTPADWIWKPSSHCYRWVQWSTVRSKVCWYNPVPSLVRTCDMFHVSWWLYAVCGVFNFNQIIFVNFTAILYSQCRPCIQWPGDHQVNGWFDWAVAQGLQLPKLWPQWRNW